MIEFKCHWDENRKCEKDLLCRICEYQPSDDEKKNGKEPPKALLWVEGYGGEEPKCPSCGEMPYSYERCVFCGQKLINTHIEREPEYIGATLVEPDEDCGFARIRCNTCGEIIHDDNVMLSHGDDEDFFTYSFRHKCGGVFTTKHWR